MTSRGWASSIHPKEIRERWLTIFVASWPRATPNPTCVWPRFSDPASRCGPPAAPSNPVPTAIVPFRPAHLPAVIRFAERTWRWQQSDAFYRWRFVEAPAEMLLAVRGDECLAMISLFKRTYRVDAGQQTFAETFDWYSLPGLRSSGLG